MQCPNCGETKNLYNRLYGLIVSEWRCLICSNVFEYTHYREGSTTRSKDRSSQEGSETPDTQTVGCCG